MLKCPFCQTDLTDNTTEAGQCFTCGGLVSWQGDYQLEDLEPLAIAPVIQREARAAGTSDSGLVGVLPAVVTDVPAVPEARQSARAHMPRDKSERIRSIWEGTFSDFATPSTSLKGRDPYEFPEDFTPEDHLGTLPEHKEQERTGPGLDSAVRQRMRTMWQAGQSSAAAGGSAASKSRSGTRKSTLVIGSRALSDASSEPNRSGADYELLTRIGEGGMGVVYAARQASIDRVVAVKMLHRDIAENREQRDKFLSEAVVTAELDHPNIVPIHDLGTNEAGLLFYSMKRVQGTPWSDVIRSRTLPENLDIFQKVCDAVAFAHTRGVIHRDLKPENVMLGDFGEVLVMDWGLAVATTAFRRLDSITQSCSMGGTPAYMAPEMATGPVESIGKASDIYLLGAILYEMISGFPPHAGRDTMDCLYAAAANRIEPTDQESELLDIARQAMATEPAARPESVQELQKSVRDYQSHAESVRISDRAEQRLAAAGETNDYRDFAAAMYGFQEALQMWTGNSRAASGLVSAQLAYARCALQKSDFDLAASLLDESCAAHTQLRREILVAKQERDNRLQRMRQLRWLVSGSAVAVFATICVAFVWIRADRNRALAAEEKAILEESRAKEAEQVANTNLVEARAQRAKAESAAEREEQAAFSARQAADTARQAKEAEEYESYLARIGLAAEKIEENAFREARRLLAESSVSAHRHWEWGRLQYICQTAPTQFPAEGSIDALAINHSDTFVAVGCRTGCITIWSLTDRVGRDDAAPHAPHCTIKLPGNYVHALCFIHDGQYLATGTSDGHLRIFDAHHGNAICDVPGHDDAILSLALSPDGRYLLSGSYDNSATLWDLQQPAQPKKIQALREHSWWVWDVAFSRDGQRIVTSGQDGKAIVWQANTVAGGATIDRPEMFQKHTEFTGHQGPVYSAVFSPDGNHVVSAGYDKRVLVWDVRKVQPTNVERRVAGELGEPPVFRALDGHTAPVRAVAFSPDGTRIVSGGMDNSLRIWDATTGESVKTLRGHEREVRALSFSADGRTVYSGSHDKTVRCWQIGDYQEVRMLQVRTLAGHSDAVLAARYSADGKRLVTASRDRTAKVWDAQSSQLIHELKEGHEYLASSAIFFPDGKRLLTGGGDNTVRVWDVATGAELLALDQAGRNGAVALSSDGHYLLTGKGQQTSYWELSSGKLKQTLAEHRGNVTAVACSHGGTALFTADATGQCALWDAQTGQRRWMIDGHGTTVTAASFLPSDDLIVTASGDTTVAFWDVATGQERSNRRLRHPEWVSGLAVSPADAKIITCCEDSTVRVWSSETSEQLGTLHVPASKSAFAFNLRRIMASNQWQVPDVVRLSQQSEARVHSLLAGEVLPEPAEIESLAQSLRVPATSLTNRKVRAVAVSRDGSRALTTDAEERTVRLWNLETFTEIVRDKSGKPSQPLLDLSSATGLLWSASFSPDGVHIATLGGNDVRLWNIVSGKEAMNFSPHGTIVSVSFSHNNSRIVTGSWDNSAKIWDVSTGRVIRKLVGGHIGHIHSAVFSPDDRHILTSSDDHTARCWDVESGEPLDTIFTGHGAAVSAAVYSADGRLVLTTSRDRTARIWDAVTGNHMRTLVDEADVEGPTSQPPQQPSPLAQTSHRLGVLCGAFFQIDGRLYAVTGSEDGTGKTWDVESGKALARLEGHIGPITSVAASPDGRRIITGSQDATAKVWDSLAGKEVLTLKGHSQEVTCAVFSPDGQEILTSSRDGLAIVWPAKNWRDHQKLSRHKPISLDIPSGYRTESDCMHPEITRRN